MTSRWDHGFKNPHKSMAYGQTADLSRLYGLMGKIMVSVRCQYKKHAMLSTVGSTNDL